MKVITYGEWESLKELNIKVQNSLEELGLKDFIKVESRSDIEFKTELGIEQAPALVIEEESIDFKDIIFQGTIPQNDEIKAMFVSIVGWGENSGWSCGTSDSGCGTCTSC